MGKTKNFWMLYLVISIRFPQDYKWLMMYELLTKVNVKTRVFCSVTPCSFADSNQCFWEICRLHCHPLIHNIGTRLEVSGQHHAPAALTLKRTAGSTEQKTGRRKSHMSLMGFEPQITQPVASHYAVYAVPILLSWTCRRQTTKSHIPDDSNKTW
jgi:hypothetical protein